MAQEELPSLGLKRTGRGKGKPKIKPHGSLFTSQNNSMIQAGDLKDKQQKPLEAVKNEQLLKKKNGNPNLEPESMGKPQK